MTTRIPVSLELLTSDYARDQSNKAMQLRDKDSATYLAGYPELISRIAPSPVEVLVKKIDDKHSKVQFHNRLVETKNKISPVVDIKGKAAKKAAKKLLQEKKHANRTTRY